jgi:hypothetical protein
VWYDHLLRGFPKLMWLWTVCYFKLYAKSLARSLPNLPNLRSIHIVRWPLRVCGDLDDEDLVKLRTILMYLPALEELQIPEIDKDDPNKTVGSEGEFESDMDDVIDNRQAHLRLPPLKRLRVLRMDNWEWLEMHMSSSLEDLYVGPIWQEHQTNQCSHLGEDDREFVSQFTSLRRLRLELVSLYEDGCVEPFMSMLTRFRDLEVFEMEIERGELRRTITTVRSVLFRFSAGLTLSSRHRSLSQNFETSRSGLHGKVTKTCKRTSFAFSTRYLENLGSKDCVSSAATHLTRTMTAPIVS